MADILNKCNSAIVQKYNSYNEYNLLVFPIDLLYFVNL